MPTALSSGTTRSASLLIPEGSSVRNATAPAFVLIVSLAFPLALGADLALEGRAASSAARRASRSAFFAAASAFLAASSSALEEDLAVVSAGQVRWGGLW